MGTQDGHGIGVGRGQHLIWARVGASTKGSELIIYPDAGHGGVFQHHEEFAPAAAFLAD